MDEKIIKKLEPKSHYYYTLANNYFYYATLIKIENKQLLELIKLDKKHNRESSCGLLNELAYRGLL